MTRVRAANSPFRRHVRLLCAAGVLWLASAAAAAAFVPRPAPGRLLLELRSGVQVRPDAAKPGGSGSLTGEPGLDALAAHFDVQALEAQFAGETAASQAIAGSDLSRFFVLQFSESIDLETIRAAYAADPAVVSAEFDVLQPLALDVNDAGTQWHLESALGKDAHVTGGWNHSPGDSTVLLAIADSGVDWQHPDLGGSAPNFSNGNVWINWAEYQGVPGVDDDANGKVDDVRGWDFVSSLSGAWPGEDAVGEDSDPRDFNGHGTHVAGIAGASTNNGVGVAGVGYRCRVMALRIGGSINDGGVEQGVVLMSAAASALNYARQKGAVAFNCSWGSSWTPSLDAAVTAAVAQGMVIVVAAGNGSSGQPSYLSSRGDCFDVAASGADDIKASFSNYGSWVDVTAPGVAIYSTYFNHLASGGAEHTYETLQGTSMAAPVVTGLVGLVKARTPALSGAEIKLVIQQGCDNIDALNPGMAGMLGAGRVNALRVFGDYNLAIPIEYSTFERALAASGAGDTLALRGGDVYTSVWYLWRSHRLIQGGWDGSFTVRDPEQNPTLVQCTGNGPALEVVAGMDSTLVVDGVSFAGGAARQLSIPLSGYFGGGVLCIDASPIFRHCRFVGNGAGDAFNFGGGGGGFFSGSSAQLVDCVFMDNSAQAGAGLYVHDSSLSIQGGRIQGNVLIAGLSTPTGGGIHLQGGTLALDGVLVADNLGADEGGGIYVQGANLVGRAVVLRANAAASEGGNLRLVAGGALTLRASQVRGGTAPFGAGISAADSTAMTLLSSLFADNVATYLGGAIYAEGATGTFRNVTWNGNRGTRSSADAVYAVVCPSAWVLQGCLVSNHAGTTKPALYFGGTAPQLDYNTFWNNAGGNLTGGTLGAHDTIADPLYVNAAAGDLALGLHSPALDSGDPSPASDDPDGTRNDRGAFGGPDAESRAPAPPTALQVVRATGPLRNVLTWNASSSPDVMSVAIYRGGNAGFVPSAACHVASVPAGTGTFSDAGGAWNSFYRLAAVDSSAASSGFTPAVQPANTTDASPVLPKRFALHPNAPNPFNPTTVLRFDLPVGARVRLEVYDSAGRLVRRLADGWRDAGTFAVTWDGRDLRGRASGSGIYVARFEAGGFGAAHKLVLVR